MNDRRVVITGLGVITPVGNDLESFWHSLKNGVSGIRTITAFNTTAYDCRIGGEVRGAIYAEERVELQATSVVHGDVHTKRLLIQEGGEINGVLRMGEDAGQPPQVSQRGAQALARA